MILSYRGPRGCVIQCLIVFTWTYGYKVSHDRWSSLLKKGGNTFLKEDIGNQIRSIAYHKYNVYEGSLVCGDNRMSAVLPFKKDEAAYVEIDWTGPKWVFRCEASGDIKPFVKVLKAFELERIFDPITIDDRELKIGEWLASLLFELCGDPASAAMAIDQAEDRK